MEQGCIPVQDAGMVRKAWCITVSCVAGLGVWFATVAAVPTGDRVSGLRMQLLWIAMIVGAAMLGYLFSNDDGLVAFGMSGGPFVAAFWTAPRGDGDGLWVLFFPYLIVMGFVLLLVAWSCGRLHDWLVRTSGRTTPDTASETEDPP